MNITIEVYNEKMETSYRKMFFSLKNIKDELIEIGCAGYQGDMQEIYDALTDLEADIIKRLLKRTY